MSYKKFFSNYKYNYKSNLENLEQKIRNSIDKSQECGVKKPGRAYKDFQGSDYKVDCVERDCGDNHTGYRCKDPV